MYVANNDQSSNPHAVSTTVIHERYLEALKNQRREALILGVGYGVSITSFCWYFGLQLHTLLS
ncbi:hypothetical protein [Phytopseudomonas dryadis]|uniref:Uncharacterized protein n=1 Tax=Phytopseudomonas dryadis TaxID=2487520 RepID=A0A4Q9RBC0_9GAMM|nr:MULTISPECIES: hypothetical protein [Pseudomonas]TBU97498.1 hypothetical protein DNK44_00480 [Pseudomonas dryadis]TBV09970.1 hypothetical protein DNK34_00580 [Pseudomonas dryadis]TBV15613.1 hypothetical protein DNK41_17450 [Pseudomonas sp. FRB 230]